MEIIFCWIPFHKNILGNVIVNSLAKKGALKRNLDFIVMYHFDLQNYINGCIFNNWKEDWLKIENKHLKKTLPTITKYDQMALPRKQQIILNRLKIGHCISSLINIFSTSNPRLTAFLVIRE